MNKPEEHDLTVHVPLSFKRRGGRKLIVIPAGIAIEPDRPRVDNAMVKALARAFRWRRLLEAGAHGTIEELAAAEKINPSYVSRILRLTLLAPEVVESIVDGRPHAELTLSTIMKPFPLIWTEQASTL